MHIDLDTWNADLFSGKTGLDGDGGFLIMVGDAISSSVADGVMRITGEFVDLAIYKSSMKNYFGGRR